MSVSEHDLEILEASLDGELSETQAESLQQRLQAEPQLAATLEQLRGDRAMRASIWQAMEPRDRESDLLVSNIRRGVRKEDLIDSRFRTLRKYTGVAAAVAIFFMAGWMSHGRVQVGKDAVAVDSNPKAQQPVIDIVPIKPAPNLTPSDVRFNNVENVAFTQRSGADSMNMPINPNSPISQTLPRYRVNVVSPMGNVFNYVLEKPADFADLPQRLTDDELAIRNRPSPLLPQIVPQKRPQRDFMPINDIQP